jgi:hypothetical protein
VIARLPAYACGLVWASAVLGCTGDTDPPWQLDHDRIIAVRATPPRIAAGEQAMLDALIGAKGAPVADEIPNSATVVSPASLAAAVARVDTGYGPPLWIVTAPSAGDLDRARRELGLAADALVPLRVQVGYAEGSLVATKTVWLGGAAATPAANPIMPHLVIDHVMIDDPSSSTELVVPRARDVALASGLDDARYDVTWLSSCGTMHDFDLPDAHLEIEAGDPTSGELALVVRDSAGGVSWQVWQIRAQ